MTSYDAVSSGSIVNQIQREFDGLGQMTTEWQAVGGAVNTSTSPKVQYAYSFAPSGSTNHSRLTSITYPNGRVITYNYASGLNADISRLSSISDGGTTLESYEYLGYGTVVKRGHAEPGVDLTFLKQGMESNGDAGDPYNGLDRFGRNVDQRWRDSSTDLERRQYGHDRDSNRLYFENLVESTRSELYAYDGFNQLSSMDRGTLNGGKTGLTGSASRSQAWDYDGLGNWDSLTTDGGSAETRTHNKQNEITGIAGASTPTYDNNGNLLTDETGKQFVYDSFNRLVTVKNSGGTTLASYQYDATGRRVRETRSGTTTDLYYSSQWQVLEERVSGSAVKSYVWSPVYVDAMIARDRDTDANGSLDERLYAVHDANFNIVALLDTSGAVVERFAYDAFGVFSVLTPAWGARGSSSYGWNYLHQGGRWDAGGTVYSFRHREYSPTLGRWNQIDPLGLAADGNNLYRAIQNGPIRKLDPRGLQTTIIEIFYDQKDAENKGFEISDLTKKRVQIIADEAVRTQAKAGEKVIILFAMSPDLSKQEKGWMPPPRSMSTADWCVTTFWTPSFVYRQFIPDAPQNRTLRIKIDLKANGPPGGNHPYGSGGDGGYDMTLYTTPIYDDTHDDGKFVRMKDDFIGDVIAHELLHAMGSGGHGAAGHVDSPGETFRQGADFSATGSKKFVQYAKLETR